MGIGDTCTTLEELVEWITVHIDDAPTVQSVRPWVSILTMGGIDLARAIRWVQTSCINAISAEYPKQYAHSLIKKWLLAGEMPGESEAQEARRSAASPTPRPEVIQAERDAKQRDLDESRRSDEEYGQLLDRMSLHERGVIETRVREQNPEMATILNRSHFALRSYMIHMLKRDLIAQQD